jgi:dienelactone hydrolase
VATGDFNGDGKLDLAVTNNLDNTVSIFTGNGDGTFKALGTAATGQSPGGFAAADFNGDGKLDLAIPNSATVSILLGKGDGTFETRVEYSTGQGANTVAVGDFNRDGKLDLAVANYGPGFLNSTVSILLGNGNGSFQPQVAYAAGVNPAGVLVGDFNRDGKLDLAVVNNNSPDGISILLGNGDGSFQNPVFYPLGRSPRMGIVADFNSDGKLDLAVANDGDNDVSILLGNGDGSFRAPVNYPVGAGPNALRGADFNGDGKLDLVTANQSGNSVSVLLGNGDGTFQAHTDYSAGLETYSIAVGDFNADGRLDVALADHRGNTVSVLLQQAFVSLSNTSLTFADQVIGTNSASQAVTLANGELPLTISGIAVTGTNATDFSQNNTCGSGLPAGERCTIGVTFRPTQLGPRTASVNITDDAVGSPQTVALSGTGVASGPNATLSATSLAFATQPAGTTSPAQSVTLTNYGTVALSISGIGFTGADPGDFAETNTCNGAVAPGATCTISVTFQPTSINARNATLSIADNAPGSSQTISLSGEGTVVELNPASLSFGVVQAGQRKSLPTTLTNVGSTTLSITGLTITGSSAFSQTNTCPLSLGAGASCTITVTFKPGGRGGFTGAASISDNGGASPQQVPLSGSGCVIQNGRCKVALNLQSPAVQSALTANSKISVPNPTGPGPVGTRVTHLVDFTRNDPFLANGTKRELLVRFWYPASLTQGCDLAQYTSPRVWSYFSLLAAIPLPEVRTNSCMEAPITDGAHPVVVFTHGYTGTFTDYTFIFEDLASRGYVVASVDHTYEATAVDFPDGRFVQSVLGSHLANTWRMDDQSLSLALSVRSQDLKFVANELERLNAAADSPFFGKLDTSHIGLMGHSLGGQAALSGIEQDTRFQAGVLIDGMLTEAPAAVTDKPLLILAAGREWSDNERLLWEDLRGPRLAVNFSGAEHVTPTDAVWLAKSAVLTGSMGPDNTIAAIRSYIAAFLDASLRGQPLDPLLGTLSSEYSDAVVTTERQSLAKEGADQAPAARK